MEDNYLGSTSEERKKGFNEASFMPCILMIISDFFKHGGAIKYSSWDFVPQSAILTLISKDVPHSQCSQEQT